MKKEPLVTVLLITYNHINTFERAIQSVLSQNVNFEYKVVINDDCSTDGTSKLVKKYSSHPNIECVIRENNIGSTENIYSALKSINTKYFCILETDDYWCDDNKLQCQVDALEANPNCSYCAHNTLMVYDGYDKTTKYLKRKNGVYKFPNSLSRKKYFEPHTSSRLYRTDCLDLDNIKDKVLVTYDIASNFYYLTKGDLFYIDKVMSVYNITWEGIYSKLSSYEQVYKSARVINSLNIAFDYKYNYLFSGFFVKRLALTPLRYLKLRYLTSKTKLADSYAGLLDKYYNDFLSAKKKKCLFRLALPISDKKRICFEITREKDIV